MTADADEEGNIGLFRCRPGSAMVDTGGDVQAAITPTTGNGLGQQPMS